MRISQERRRVRCLGVGGLPPDHAFFPGTPKGRVGCGSPFFRQPNARLWWPHAYFLAFSPFQGCSPRMRREVLLEPVRSSAGDVSAVSVVASTSLVLLYR